MLGPIPSHGLKSHGQALTALTPHPDPGLGRQEAPLGACRRGVVARPGPLSRIGVGQVGQDISHGSWNSWQFQWRKMMIDR